MTPVFRFRLERVRNLRERAEDLAREQFAASLHHRREGEALLSEADARIEQARMAGRPDPGAVLTGSDLAAAQAFLERTERAHTAAELELDRRQAEVDARRQALAVAAQERAALERLKDRAKAEHAREVERVETARLDELALGMHRRREQRS